MKTFVFNRENNKFDDILKDRVIKPAIREKYQFAEHLIIRVEDKPEVLAYLTLIFSEELKSMKDLVPDRTPKPYIDYTPRKNKKETG